MTFRPLLRNAAACLPALALAGSLAVGAAAAPAEPRRWAILVAGLAGDPELQKEYLGWMRDLHGLLVGPLGFARENVFVLADDPSKDASLVRSKSDRESLAALCRELAGRAGREDLVFVFVAGHGSSDAKGYKLNLPGPDPTAEELAAMLYSIPAERFIVVNTTTASGASVGALAGKGKIVVAATRSAAEKNQTHMGRFFIEALRGAADSDKNGRVSVLEAFAFATRKVEEHYAKAGNMQTEHAVLDDDGDGKGQTKPGPDNGEGLLARTTYWDAGRSARAGDAETAELERQIEALKYAKSGMPEAEYEKKLEELLLRLAQANARNKKP